MCRTAGTTLVELLTTLTIVAILATVAVPGFHTFHLKNQRATEVNRFLHSLFLARSEAIKRAQIVSVCPSTDGRSCAPGAGDWTRGWIVFANRDRDDPPERDAGPPSVPPPCVLAAPGWQQECVANRADALPHAEGFRRRPRTDVQRIVPVRGSSGTILADEG